MPNHIRIYIASCLLFQKPLERWLVPGMIMLLMISVVRAQTPTIDSLTRLLDAHRQEDTVKVNLLNETAYAYWNVLPAKTEAVGKDALILAQKLDFKKGIAEANRVIGIGTWMQGNYEKTSEYAFEALRIYQEIGSQEGTTKAYSLLGVLYDDQKQYDKALEYHQKALKLSKETRDSSRIATSANNIGAVYFRKEQYDESLIYFQQALEIRRSNGDIRGMAETISNMSAVFRMKGDFNQAAALVNESLEIKRRINDQNGQIISLQQLAGLYYDRQMYDQAEPYYQEALQIALNLDIRKRQMEIYYKLFDIKESQQQYQQALEYYKKYVAVADTMQNEETAARLAELEAAHETAKQKQEIIQLQQDNKIKTIFRNLFGLSALGFIIVAIFIYRFFSYRNRKNQELLKTQRELAKQLQETDQMKSRFFANISHEFRTPLTLILDPIDELLARNTDQRSQDYLHIMQRNAKRLQQLINQFLDLSKLEAGKLDLRASPSNFVTFLRGLTMAFHSLAERRGVELEFAAQEEDILLFFDHDKLEKVFTNLISNAIKFTKSNGAVSIAINRAELNKKPALEVLVQDTGIGIPKEHLPYIFDWFYQVNNADNSAIEGTGVGLALAKELVELHHGQINVTSEKGTGTVFRVVLPLGKDHLREEEIVPISRTFTFPSKQMLPDDWEDAHIALRTKDDTAKPTILLVEDNADLRLFISQTLTDHYTIETADDGQAGLERAQDLIPDLIISDVMMPRMDGITLCKRLKSDEKTSHIPVILLTAKNAEEDKLEALESQADDYLIKPFNTRELLARIKNLIGLRKQLKGKLSDSIILKPRDIEVPSVEKAFLEKLMDIIETNVGNENFGVEELSRAMAMSRSQLHRKLVAITDRTPSQFVRSYRLQRAHQLLLQNAGSVADIAFEVGFSSAAYFTKCFTEEFGFSPKEVRLKVE